MKLNILPSKILLIFQGIKGMNLIGTLYEHNIVIFPCFNLICDCILYMVKFNC